MFLESGSCVGDCESRIGFEGLQHHEVSHGALTHYFSTSISFVTRISFFFFSSFTGITTTQNSSPPLSFLYRAL